MSIEGGLRDHLRLYRIRDWLHFMPLPLAGWVTLEERSPRALAAGLFGWALALAYTSAINQAFDARVDVARVDKNPVGAGAFTARGAALRAVPMGLLALVSVGLGARSGTPAVLALLLAATLYSAPPRLKRWPVVGTLWNLMVGLPGLFFAGGARLSVPPLGLFVGAFSVLLATSQLLHEAEDHGDDRQGGVFTTARLLGRRGTLRAASGVILLLPVVAGFSSAAHPRAGSILVASLVFALAVAGRLMQATRGAPMPLRPLRLTFRWAALGFGALLFGLAIL